MKHWTADNIHWERFDRAKLDPDILAVVKAACLVERNAPDYVTYLSNVFTDDQKFLKGMQRWQAEEVQHGEVLGRYAELADSGFDYKERFRRFTEGYRIPLEATHSVRGSRTGELIARCVVETGTSSFYSALRDATSEPVLKEICERIANDEFRHYRMFYAHMQRYLARERLGRWRRALVVLGRYREIDDDELAYAYHCGNAADDRRYDRRRAAEAYERRAYACYARPHVQRAVAMMLKPIGFSPEGWLGRALARLAWRHMRSHALQASAA